MDRKIIDFFRSYLVHRQLKELPWRPPVLLRRVNNEDHLGFLWCQEEIEENIPNTGAHIFDPDRGGKCVTSLQAAQSPRDRNRHHPSGYCRTQRPEQGPHIGSEDNRISYSFVHFVRY